MLVGRKNVEVYSVDEAFLDLSHFNKQEVEKIATEIKDTVENWTGIKVSVGIAPTKVLAKLANKLAKKNKKATGCIMLLDEPTKIESALKKTAVGDIWGVGNQYAKKLIQQWCIYDAWQLSNVSEEFARTHLGGVVGVRLIRELKGDTGKEMEDELVNKKMIATTRMFGAPVNDIVSIKEAVATYASRAAEKLRRQHSAAKVISVFIVTKEEDHYVNFRRGATFTEQVTLPAATSITNELIKPAVAMVDSLYKSGNYYKKAGVMLSGLVPDSSIQGNLFKSPAKNAERRLMEMIDNVNFSQRDDILKFAASGTERNWKMQQNHVSSRYTSRWDELFEVH
jgi:DNA polymerase V